MSSRTIVLAGILASGAHAQGVVQPPVDPALQILQLRLQEAQQRNLLLRQQLESIREVMRERQQVVPPLGSAPLVTPQAGPAREQFRQRIVDEFLGVPVPEGVAPAKAFAPPLKKSSPPVSLGVPVPTDREDPGSSAEILPIAPDGTAVPGRASGFATPPRIDRTPLSSPGATQQ